MPALIPSLGVNFDANALGLSGTDVTGIQVKLGTCSLGSKNIVQAFNDKRVLKDTLGVGPLVSAVAHTLDVAGGPVLAVRVNSDVAATIGAVTKATFSTGTGSVAVTGTPLDAYRVVVEIRSDAATITAPIPGTYRYSLDSGITWSADLTIPSAGTYAIAETGLTLTFANGGASTTSFKASDSYTATCTAPGYTLNALKTALDALLADDSLFFMAHVLGAPADGTAAAALLSYLEATLAGAEQQYIFAIGLMEMPSSLSSSAAKSALSAIDASHMAVAWGDVPVLCPITGWSLQRSVAWLCGSRLGAIPPRELPGYTKSTKGGPLKGTTLVKGSDGKFIGMTHDEAQTPGMEAAGFFTIRTWRGKAGVYATKGRMFTAVASDFGLIPRRRIINQAARTAYETLHGYINGTLETKPDGSGTLSEREARAIESEVAEAIRTALIRTNPPNARDVKAVVDRTIDVLRTGRVECYVGILPFAYSDFVGIRMAYTADTSAASA